MVAEQEQEQVWVEGLRNGDSACYRQVVEAYIGPLLRVARRYLREEDACDAVQETFIKVFGAIKTFRGESRLLTWIQRILINQCISKLRAQERLAEVSIDDLLPSYYDDGHRIAPTPAWPESLSTVVDRERLCRLVEKHIAKLPLAYRTVLMLRDIEGISGKETAELLNLSVGAVKVRLHRARQALRTLMDPVMQGDTLDL